MSSSLKLASSLTLGAALVLSTAACGSDSPSTPAETVTVTETAEAAPAETSTETSTDAATEEGDAEGDAGAPTHTDPAARAAQAALAARPGDVISIDPEGGDVWSVQVRTTAGEGTEVYVNATTGEVQRERPEALPSEARDGMPAITAVEAIDIALGAAEAGAAVGELDLGTERGTVVWEIKVREGSGGTEFYIDASTGAIVKQEAADWD